MKVEKRGNGFIVVSGSRKFCFFVDHNSSCWTLRNTGDVQQFATEQAANDVIAELKMRTKIRRNERKAQP
jgi:hypothetical protein